MTSEAQESGLLFIEQSHRVIDQLQDDPNLIEMTRVPTDNPVEIRTSPSGLEPIQIEEIMGSDNPEVSMPHVRSLGDVSAQPEIARTSGRASAPNPLHNLITIYNDEEIS
jgi:hypothetical protein